MALNALFDPKKKALVEDALKKGDLSPVFKGKPLTEPEAGAGTAKGEASGGTIGIGANIHMRLSDPPQFEIRGIRYTATELLILAIRYNDFDAAKMALDAGAEYDKEYRHFPPDPGDQIPESCTLLITSSPRIDAWDCDDRNISHLIDKKREEDKANK